MTVKESALARAAVVGSCRVRSERGEDGCACSVARADLLGAWNLSLAGAALLPSLAAAVGCLPAGAEGAAVVPWPAQPARGREPL